MEQVWQELKGKDELTHCKTCGKKIWKFWKVSEELEADGSLKSLQEMEECAPCYFTYEKNNN